MRVIVNGESREVTGGTTVEELLRELEVRAALVAVEVNGTVIPRRQRTETAVQEGDRIEIVTFVGGG